MCRSEPRREVKHIKAQQELIQSVEHSESNLQEYTTPYYMSKGDHTEQRTLPKLTVKNLKTMSWYKYGLGSAFIVVCAGYNVHGSVQVWGLMLGERGQAATVLWPCYYG